MRRVLALACILALGGCSGPAEREASIPPREPPPSPPSPSEVPSLPPPSTPARMAGAVFDADSAWAGLVRQVEFGPRVPGTAAHRECADWLAQRLSAAGGEVERQSFSYLDPEGREWPLQNILARFGPPGGGRLLLVAHWDTRPWADLDPDPQRRDTPIPGANDGASGVAVLLEIARNLGGAALPRGVDVLLVDGEDLGEGGLWEGFCRGSREFASRGVGAYRRAVVLDMIGDADLSLPIEGYSLAGASEVVDWVWQRGLALAPEVFSRTVGPRVFDDHVPLMQAGLPAVDIIDFDYPAWHTTADDLSQVSPRSLEAVGRVVLSLALDP